VRGRSLDTRERDNKRERRKESRETMMGAEERPESGGEQRRVSRERGICKERKRQREGSILRRRHKEQETVERREGGV
jgi:hypothetical protein